MREGEWWSVGGGEVYFGIWRGILNRQEFV